MTNNIETATELELLRQYEAILTELVRRGVSRTYDAPVRQYAEWLAVQRLGGQLAANSVKSYGLCCPELGKVQVKSPIARSGKGGAHLAPFRSFDFDHASIIIFDTDYCVKSATTIPVDVMRLAGSFRQHVNGRIVTPTPQLLAQGLDITDRFATEPSAGCPDRHPLHIERLESVAGGVGYGQ